MYLLDMNTVTGCRQCRSKSRWEDVLNGLKIIRVKNWMQQEWKDSIIVPVHNKSNKIKLQ